MQTITHIRMTVCYELIQRKVPVCHCDQDKLTVVRVWWHDDEKPNMMIKSSFKLQTQQYNSLIRTTKANKYVHIYLEVLGNPLSTCHTYKQQQNEVNLGLIKTVSYMFNLNNSSKCPPSAEKHAEWTHLIRAPIVAIWADRFSQYCWWQFSQFFACSLILPPVSASCRSSSLLQAVAAA